MLSKSRVLGYKTYQFMKPKNQRFRQKKVQKNVFTKLPIKENTILYESFWGEIILIVLKQYLLIF